MGRLNYREPKEEASSKAQEGVVRRIAKRPPANGDTATSSGFSGQYLYYPSRTSIHGVHEIHEIEQYIMR